MYSRQGIASDLSEYSIICPIRHAFSGLGIPNALILATVGVKWLAFATSSTSLLPLL